MSIVTEAKIALGQRRSLDRLQAIVLLGGTVRATDFSNAIGRSIVDLPVESKKTILDSWCLAARDLALSSGLEKLQLRVMVDRDSQQPVSGMTIGPVELSIERDPLEYRGTGGVLKDLSGNYNERDYLLVGNAAQILIGELRSEVEALFEGNGDVNLISLPDGRPAGLMLVRCGALRNIASTGFVDLKEQAIPAIAKTHSVEVIRRRETCGLAVRNLGEYIGALRRYHQQKLGRFDRSPYAEDWESSFALAEEGADVSSGARLHDSVVLKGGVAEDTAVVVRSLIGPGGVAGRGAMAVEALVRNSKE
jgi:hypothetical protein